MTRETIRQALCGLRGHDQLLQLREHHMALRCVSCGHETPGWALNETPPTVTVKGDARRHRIHRLRVTTRRIA